MGFWITDYNYNLTQELIDLVPVFIFWFQFKTISILKLKEFHEQNIKLFKKSSKNTLQASENML